MHEDIFKLNPGYVFEVCQHGLEVWSKCATVHVGHWDRALEIWKWNKNGAKTLDINIPLDMTEDDEDDENTEQKEPAEENVAPKEEPDHKQLNAEAMNEPQPDPVATPRPASEMSEEPSNKVCRKQASGTL